MIRCIYISKWIIIQSTIPIDHQPGRPRHQELHGDGQDRPRGGHQGGGRHGGPVAGDPGRHPDPHPGGQHPHRGSGHSGRHRHAVQGGGGSRDLPGAHRP